MMGIHKYNRKGHDELWEWFGCSRSSWATLNRALMHEMPDEWQGKMAALLEEWDATYTNWPDDIGGTRVQITSDGKLTKTPAWILNYRHPDKAMIESIKDKGSDV